MSTTRSDTAAPFTRYKLTVDEYQRMGETGILGEDARVELIEGELIALSPIGDDHAITVNSINKTLVLACGDNGIVAVQNPLKLNRVNMPQPDFVIFRPRADNYRRGNRPNPAKDVLLVIEVADSSLRFDQTVKLPLYAQAGIPEFWIVDLARRLIDAHSAPTGGAYATTRTYTQADTATLAAAPHITIPLAGLLD